MEANFHILSSPPSVTSHKIRVQPPEQHLPKPENSPDSCGELQSVIGTICVGSICSHAGVPTGKTSAGGAATRNCKPPSRDWKT